MEISTEDLQYICQLISDVHGLPIYYVNGFGEFEYEFSSNDLRSNPYYVQFKEQINVYTYEDNPIEFPIFFSNSNLNFFIVNLKESDRYLGAIIGGPVLESEIADENITKIMEAFKGSVNKRNLIEYYQAVPIIDNQKLLVISLLMYYLIYRKTLEQSYVIENNKALDLEIIESEKLDLELSKGRRNFIFHSLYRCWCSYNICDSVFTKHVLFLFIKGISDYTYFVRDYRDYFLLLNPISVH